MLLLSVPVLLPIILKIGFDPIWFGVFAVKLIEIGLVTPPVGLTVFVVKSVAPQIPLSDIFKGIIPFVMGDLVVITLIIAFPQIVMVLPNHMG
jgi:C4-dicarboxylate transporter, DctM subunit